MPGRPDCNVPHVKIESSHTQLAFHSCCCWARNHTAPGRPDHHISRYKARALTWHITYLFFVRAAVHREILQHLVYMTNPLPDEKRSHSTFHLPVFHSCHCSGWNRTALGTADDPIFRYRELSHIADLFFICAAAQREIIQCLVDLTIPPLDTESSHKSLTCFSFMLLFREKS